MRRRVLGVAAAVASLTLVAAACGGGGDTGGSEGSSAGGEPAGTISVWARDSQKGFMTQLVDTYNKSHTVQAKVTMFMPIIFSVMFFFFPSGLVLYWVVNNILSITQQWFITRKLNPPKPA